MLVGAALLSHLWRQAAWERRLSNLPQASTLDLMCWLESQPSPTRTFKRRKDVTEHAEDRKEPRHAKLRNPERGETRSLNLNEASAEDLTLLAGIGTVLSPRIVKFRSALGGFSSVDQLYMVYGLEPRPEALAPCAWTRCLSGP